MTEFFQLTFAPLLVAVLASCLCALPGNFLLLRREALVGDAISHAALPGIVVAFLVTGTTAAFPMMIGAAVSGLITVGLIELIKRLANIEPGAAIGVVFTSLFAAGVLLLEQSETSGVHLDVEHALYGNLESLIWFSGFGPASLISPAALADLPPQIFRLLLLLGLMAAFAYVMWRPLYLSTFDGSYARTLGVPARLTGFLLVSLTAISAVACFDAVGSILVIAMFVCPPAAARLMTDSLSEQIAWSMLFAAVGGAMGVILAGYGPLWLGFEHAVSAAGMIATVSGGILTLACLFGPKRKSVAGTD